MATNLPSCFSIEFLEQLLKFQVNFTLLKYVKSQRSYGYLITKELMFGFQILDLKDHFSASLRLISEKWFLKCGILLYWVRLRFYGIGSILIGSTLAGLWLNCAGFTQAQYHPGRYSSKLDHSLSQVNPFGTGWENRS